MKIPRQPNRPNQSRMIFRADRDLRVAGGRRNEPMATLTRTIHWSPWLCRGGESGWTESFGDVSRTTYVKIKIIRYPFFSWSPLYLIWRNRTGYPAQPGLIRLSVRPSVRTYLQIRYSAENGIGPIDSVNYSSKSWIYNVNCESEILRKKYICESNTVNNMKLMILEKKSG